MPRQHSAELGMKMGISVAKVRTFWKGLLPTSAEMVEEILGAFVDLAVKDWSGLLRRTTFPLVERRSG